MPPLPPGPAGPAAGAAPSWRGPAFLSAFAYPSFRGLWTGAFLSSIGTWTQDVALAWLIHTRLGDPFYLGLRAFAADAPLLAFMVVGGAAADRLDRRLILLSSQVLQMAYALILFGLYVTDHLGIGAILAIAFVTGLTQSQSAPTYQAVLTTLVPPREIPKAVAMNSLQFNLSRAIGPAVAGILLVKGGTGVCFAVNAVSFVAVILALWRIDMPPPPARPTESLGRSLAAGFRHVRESPVLTTLIGMSFAGSFLAYPLITYLPVVAGDLLGTGARGYSQLLSSFGVGAILGAVATAQRGHVPGRGRVFLISLGAYSLTTIAALACRRQGPAMVLLFASGFGLVCAFSILNSLMQENAPDALRGRVVSIYGLAFRGGGPLGGLLAGLLARRVVSGGFLPIGGAPAIVVAYSSVLLVLAVVLYARRSSILAL